MKQKALIAALILAFLAFAQPALYAQSVTPAAASGLTIQGDLVLHPTQMAQFFSLDTSQLNSTTSWTLPNLSFTQPYNTQWSQAVAKGPFNIQFNTSGLGTQEFAFTLTWPSPQLSVGSFALADTIHTTVSGVPVTVNVNMSCSNMLIQVPGGNWVVQGKMRYDLTSGTFVPTWETFQVQMNASATPQVNLGQCQGPASVFPAVQAALVGAANNQTMVQNLLQTAILNWVQGSLGGLQNQLLTSRTVQIQPGLTLAWQPAQVSQLSGGLLRVAGNFLLSKAGSTVGIATLARNYSASILNSVTQTEFILPHNVLQSILNYMYSNGALIERVDSTSIPAFQSLEQSRFEQFFAWPDLMNFSENALFYFDLGTSAAPQLGAGWELDNGGSAYNFSAPMLVHQWAPYKKQYLPYVDFAAPLTGQVSAGIKNGSLNVQMNVNATVVSDTFRPEFSATRDVNTYIDTADLGTSAVSYLNSTPYSIALPTWSLGNGMNMEMSDLQVWNQTFRIPLNFVSVSN